MVKYTGLDGYTLARNTQIPTCHFIVVFTFLLLLFALPVFVLVFRRFREKSMRRQALKDTT